MSHDFFTIADLKKRVQHRFAQAPDDMNADGGDDVLNPDFHHELHRRHLKPAAVLMPVYEVEGRAMVLLTQRTENLSSHKGQIAFPGGKIDQGETPVEAALREAEEEIGLGIDQVEVLGQLGPYYSGSGYHVTPVLGVIDVLPELKANAAEVADIFSTPLSFLMDQAHHRIESRSRDVQRVNFYAMPYRDEAVSPPVERYIWGLTAGIIRMIQERLYGE